MAVQRPLLRKFVIFYAVATLVPVLAGVYLYWSGKLIGSGPAGMLSPMPISSEFYETTLNCDKQCRRCHYCQDYYERHKSLC